MNIYIANTLILNSRLPEMPRECIVIITINFRLPELHREYNMNSVKLDLTQKSRFPEPYANSHTLNSRLREIPTDEIQRQQCHPTFRIA